MMIVERSELIFTGFIAIVAKVLAVGLLLLGLLLQAAQANEDQEQLQEFTNAYAELLERYLVPNDRIDGIHVASVNYRGWSTDPLHYETMAKLQELPSPFTLSEDEHLAFWINLYNYLTIDLIIKHREERSIRRIGGPLYNVWEGDKWDLFGDSYSLDFIEHQILRKIPEPRIHFAINCASVSCPNLLHVPYRGEILDAQLDAQEYQFMHDITKGVRIKYDAAGQPTRVYASKIFHWFAEDFFGEHTLPALVAEHKGVDLTGGPKWMKYNWSLNGYW